MNKETKKILYEKTVSSIEQNRLFNFRNFWGDSKLRCFEEFRRSADTRCIYCGGIADTREHIPPKIFLNKPYPDNLFDLPACKNCNNGFSADELYSEVFIDTLKTISSYSEKISDNNVVRSQRTTAYNDAKQSYEAYLKTKRFAPNERLNRVILKLAFGHSVFEVNEGAAAWHDDMLIKKIEIRYRFELNDADIAEFYSPVFMDGKLLPEIGSRAFHNIYVIEPVDKDSLTSKDIADRQVVTLWTTVQENNYEYIVWIEHNGIHIKMAIHNFVFTHIILDCYA